MVKAVDTEEHVLIQWRWYGQFNRAVSDSKVFVSVWLTISIYIYIVCVQQQCNYKNDATGKKVRG